MAINACRWIFLVALLGSATGYDTWEDYWTAYTQEKYYPRLYPYGTSYGDNEYINVASGVYVDAETKFHIPYAGKRFMGAYISAYGHMELYSDETSGFTPKDLMTVWPNQDYPVDKDPPFISPFFADWEYSKNNDAARLYWRRLDPSETTDPDEQEIIHNLLNHFSQEVNHHVVGAHDFSALYGIMVTWHDVTFGSCWSGDSCARNTIQMALVADDRHSHVIYNFYNVTWVGGVGQGCDLATGMPGDPPFDMCQAAQVGFNAGWAEGFTQLPFSKMDDVVALDDHSATGVQGRFLYQVDPPTPVRGGCTNETVYDFTIWPLEIHPRSIGMYGGDVIYFSGPCLMQEDDIMCSFDGKLEVTGTRVNNGQSIGMCVAPLMWTAGWKEMCISTNGGVDYVYCTDIHVVPKYWEWPRIQLIDLHRWNERHAEGELSFEWNPEELLYPHQRCSGGTGGCNSSDATSVVVDIKLIGYRETQVANGSRTPHWWELHTFESGTQNSGMYSFLPEDHECSMDCDYGHSPPVGLVEVSVQMEGENPRRIYSEPVPLGWHFDWELSVEHGSDWPRVLCGHWSTPESQDLSWVEEAPPCPMTHMQAERDLGRFMFPPPDCPPDESCPLMPRPDPHIACADSPIPEPHSSGASSSCCYPPTPHGSLAYGLDHPMGSMTYKASPYGNHASNGHHVVPLLSHMVQDRQPYMWCCNWTNDRDLCVEHYMTVRPSVDAAEYRVSGYAAAYGDPHFTTFDGSNFTFNGYGEYWLLYNDVTDTYDRFNLQARLKQPEPGPHGKINATLLEAVVMQEGTVDGTGVAKVQVHLGRSNAHALLMVYYNGEQVDLMGQGMRYQERIYTPPNEDDARKIVLRNNDPMHDDRQSNVSVTFQTGVHVQVANRGGYMHVVVIAPPSYWGITKGLFGLWNGDSSDDLMSKSGQPIDPCEEIDHIHSQYGQTWVVAQGDSRFSYFGKGDWMYHSNPEFVPNYKEPEAPVGNITDADVEGLCGTDFVCRFDYKTTMSADVANNSLWMQLGVLDAQNAVMQELSCPYLEVPHSERLVDTYLVGGEMVFTRCVEGYTLKGETHYICVQVSEEEAEWSPEPDVHCKSNDEIAHEKAMLATAIVVPILLLLIIAAIVIGILYYRRRKKGRTESGSATKATRGGVTGTTGDGIDTMEMPPSPQDGGKVEKRKKEKKKKAPKASTKSVRESQFEAMAESASRSQSLASVNLSYGTMVLTEELHSARPPRPDSHHSVHNTALSHISGSQPSLTGAHGYSLSPQGGGGGVSTGYANQSFDQSGVNMSSRPSQASLQQRQAQIPQYDNTPGFQGQPASMETGYQANQSQQSVPPGYQMNQSLQSIPNGFQAAPLNQSQQSLPPPPIYQMNQSRNSMQAVNQGQVNPLPNGMQPRYQGLNRSQNSMQAYPGQMNQSQHSIQQQPMAQHQNGMQRNDYSVDNPEYTQPPTNPPSNQVAPVANQTYEQPIGVANLAMADDDVESSSDVSEEDVMPTGNQGNVSHASLGGRDTFV